MARVKNVTKRRPRGNETEPPIHSAAAIFAVLATIAGAAACRSSEPSTRELVVAIEARPQDLDPRFSTDAHSSRIGALVFRGLTRSDGAGGRRPDAALDWRFVDERTLVFRLREDLRFHDGSPLTSADVRATYASVMDEATASPKRGGLVKVDTIETPDAATVVFRLKEPFAPILDATNIGILPVAAIRGRRSDLVGSGPYRIAGFDTEGGVRLVATSETTPIADLRFRVVPDDTVRALELERGSIHLVENAIEPQNLRRLGGLGRLCVRRVPGSTFHYIGANLRRRPLDDRRVRAAIAHAIDREAIVAALLAGTARPASGLFAPEHWVYEGDVARHPYDPAEAARLLDAAGLVDPDGDGPEPRFRLSYKTTPLESRRRMAEAIQAYLAAVGIAADIRSYEWGTFYADVRRGNFELYALAWIGVEEPDLAFALFDSASLPPHGHNRGGYRSAAMDALVLAGRTTLDRAERRRIYGEVQRLAAVDLPLVPLWWSETVVVHDRRLQGFEPTPDGDLGSLATAELVDGPAKPCPDDAQ